MLKSLIADVLAENSTENGYGYRELQVSTTEAAELIMELVQLRLKAFLEKEFINA